jgi:hypothetical protein
MSHVAASIPTALEARESDGHPIIENYVRSEHTACHLKSDVTPHAPEHNCDYRTPGVSLVLFLYQRCSHVLSVPHAVLSRRVPRCSDGLEAPSDGANISRSRSRGDSLGDEGSQGSPLCFDELREFLNPFALSLSALFAPARTVDKSCDAQLAIINSKSQSVGTSAARAGLFTAS